MGKPYAPRNNTLGNPYLVCASVRVILIEVTGTLPSQLQGYLEVAGRRAAVVIANPNGITCQGCGFINTSRACFTTAQLILSLQSQLKASHVTQSIVQINHPLQEAKDAKGTSFNGSNLNRVDIFARAVRLNAKIHAKTVNIFTVPPLGPIKRLGHGGADTPPAVAIDVAIDVTQLGGIYAQHIHLTGSEYGAGVNSAGDLTATESLILRSKGNLTLSGTIQCGTGKLRAKNTLTQAARIESSGRVQLHGQTQLIHPGTTLGHNLLLKAYMLRVPGRLEAHKRLILEGTHLEAQNSNLAAGRELRAKATWLNGTGTSWRVGFPEDATKAPGHLGLEIGDCFQARRGVFKTSGDISLQALSLEMCGSILCAGGQLSLKAIQGNIYLNEEAEAQAESITIESPQTFYHRHSRLVSPKIQINVSNFHNELGRVQQTGPSRLELSVGQSVDNSQGLIHAAHVLSFTGSTASLNNTQGQVITGGNLQLSLAQLMNEQGHLQSGQNLHLTLPEWTPQGKLKAEQNLTLNLEKDFDHTQAELFSAPNLFFHTQGAFVNHSTLSTPHTLHLHAARFHNHANAVVNSNQVQLHINDLLHNQGRIYGGKIALGAHRLQNEAILVEVPTPGPCREFNYDSISYELNSYESNSSLFGPVFKTKITKNKKQY